ncbi:MAG: tRNA pseudouridine(55) synthase TruB [Clostridia bacterium]|nr:tRNA pseudouridine(55) synthase TruB [Clostridia bacterium]
MKDGILIINKPQWYTSFDVVAKCRKILGTKRIGHTGTLDPMATGVLVLCIGKATGLVNMLTAEDKVYRTTIKLGIETDTADLTGRITGYIKDGKAYERNNLDMDNIVDTEKNVQYLSDIARINYSNNLAFSEDFKFDLTKEQIDEATDMFIGVQDQVPPMYSSIKIDGRKLYEYAREGEDVEVPSREIEIYDICDVKFDGKNELSYTVHCSKGTYIRTLNEDIAKELGIVGTTMVLERVQTGDYSLENAYDLEDISEDAIISIEELFADRIDLDEKDESKLLNGMNIQVDNEDGIYNIYINKKYYGLGEVIEGKLKRFIIVEEHS